MIAYCKPAGDGFRVKERLTLRLKKTTKCPSISEILSGDVRFFCCRISAKTGNAVEHFATWIIAQVYRLYKMFFAAHVIKF